MRTIMVMILIWWSAMAQTRAKPDAAAIPGLSVDAQAALRLAWLASQAPGKGHVIIMEPLVASQTSVRAIGPGLANGVRMVISATEAVDIVAIASEGIGYRITLDRGKAGTASQPWPSGTMMYAPAWASMNDMLRDHIGRLLADLAAPFLPSVRASRKAQADAQAAIDSAKEDLAK